MTSTLATDDNNDLTLGPDGNLVLLVGLPAILSACETAAKTQLGECVLAANAGVPNFQSIWVGTPNYVIFESYLRNVLQSVPGVTGVEQVTVTQNGNTLQYTAQIKTSFGSGILNGGL